MPPKTPLRILITAGPTREPIDPIRFISNYSTGTVGYELAKEAAKRHHKVVLISGPVNLDEPRDVLCLKVDTARKMKSAVSRYFKWCDCLIMAAAVSDYHPKRRLRKKMKKTKDKLSLQLLKNPDILKALSKRKTDKIIVGFSLDTESVVQNARSKLKEKNLDLIVASVINKRKNPFGKGKVDVHLIDRSPIIRRCYNISKKILSRRILDTVEKMWYT